jgi:hypothetical protein
MDSLRVANAIAVSIPARLSILPKGPARSSAPRLILLTRGSGRSRQTR